LLLLSWLTQASSIAYLVLCLIVTGIGQGLFQSPNARAIMGAAPPDELGVASGILATGRVIGQSLSVAVAGAVFTSFGGAAAGAALAASRETLRVEQTRALQQTFVTGLHAAFVVCAVLAALGVVTALLRGAEGVIRPRCPVLDRMRKARPASRSATIPPSIEHCTPRRRRDSISVNRNLGARS
jgi:amino acid permease